MREYFVRHLNLMTLGLPASFLIGAPDRTRTCTLPHQNLNLACLPVPPQAHMHHEHTAIVPDSGRMLNDSCIPGCLRPAFAKDQRP